MEMNFLPQAEKSIETIKASQAWRKPAFNEAILVFAIVLMLVMIAFNWGPVYQSIKFAFSPTDKEEIYYQQVARIYRNPGPYNTSTPSENNLLNNFGTANISNATSIPGNMNVVLTDNYIEIPKLQIKAPIVETSGASIKDIMEGLNHGVVRYADGGTPLSGQTIIMGHSSSRVPSKYGSIFALLGKLENKDVIHIKYNGVIYSYFVISKQTGSVDELKLKNFEGDLVLTSCWPPGTDSGRITVSAVRAPKAY